VREAAPIALVASILGLFWEFSGYVLRGRKDKPPTWPLIEHGLPRIRKALFGCALVGALFVSPYVRSWYIAPRPFLKVADPVRFNDETKLFTLVVSNAGAPAVISIAILRLTGGEQLHTDFLPLNLGSILLAQTPMIIPLAFFDAKDDVLKIPGNGQLRYLGIHAAHTGDILPAALCVRISVVGMHEMIEDRAFEFVPDPHKSPPYRVEMQSRSCL
jgi:hypothetical protein